MEARDDLRALPVADYPHHAQAQPREALYDGLLAAAGFDPAAHTAGGTGGTSDQGGARDAQGRRVSTSARELRAWLSGHGIVA